MDELKLYPSEIGGTVVEVLVTVFGDETRGQSFRLASELRAAGVRTEVYLQDKGVGKQITYADKKRIPLVALLGSDEIAQGTVKLKRLRDGVEVTVPRAEAAAKARELVG
jgi:histidyl-tRNA synthetase